MSALSLRLSFYYVQIDILIGTVLNADGKIRMLGFKILAWRWKGKSQPLLGKRQDRTQVQNEARSVAVSPVHARAPHEFSSCPKRPDLS